MILDMCESFPESGPDRSPTADCLLLGPLNSDPCGALTIERARSGMRHWRLGCNVDAKPGAVCEAALWAAKRAECPDQSNVRRRASRGLPKWQTRRAQGFGVMSGVGVVKGAGRARSCQSGPRSSSSDVERRNQSSLVPKTASSP